MGMNRNIYVREADRELWERAENYAKARRLTMSALIMNALDEYLRNESSDPEDTKPR